MIKCLVSLGAHDLTQALSADMGEVGGCAGVDADSFQYVGVSRVADVLEELSGAVLILRYQVLHQVVILLRQLKEDFWRGLGVLGYRIAHVEGVVVGELLEGIDTSVSALGYLDSLLLGESPERAVTFEVHSLTYVRC